MKPVSQLFRLFFALTLLCGAWAVAPIQTAQAIPPQIIVSTTADELDGGSGNGLCALREAIANVNNANQGQVDCDSGSLTSTITLPGGTYQLTRTGANEDDNASGDLDIRASLTINGVGAGSTFIQAGTNDSDGIDRVLHLPVSGVSVVLNDLTIRYGHAPNGMPGTAGNTGANGADGTTGDAGEPGTPGSWGDGGTPGSPNGSDGGLGNSGTSGSDGTNADNGVFGDTGGIGGDGQSGGGIYSLANLTLNRCRVSDNRAGNGGEGGRGGDGGLGGRGGDGGVGGRGGDGGPGGNAYDEGDGTPDANGGNGGNGSDGSPGGQGGAGGNGGDGGGGGNGGNGGSGGGIFQNGAMLNLYATTLSNNHTGAGNTGGPGGTRALQGSGGAGGTGGTGGDGGAGGAKANDGTDGANGTPGNQGGTGNVGADGSPGTDGGPGDVGGSGRGGGLYNNDGTLNMLGCLVSANTAAGNVGGGLVNTASATANIANSTFSGNSADATLGDILHNQGEIALSNNTLMANTSNYTFWNGSGATAWIKNTIIKDSNSCWNEGILTNSLNNFFDSDCENTVTGSGNVDWVGIASNIGALADNGGSTYTHALANNSNAIDAVSDCTYLSNGTNPLFIYGDPITVDQRGEPRNDLACDVGAFELQFGDPGGETVVKEVHGPGVFTFGPTGVKIMVTDTGSASLTRLIVTFVRSDHVAARGTAGDNGVGWGEYWSIEADLTASGFLANLTLPATAPSDTTRVCRYTLATGWECSDHNNGYTTNSVTRDDINEFSDWAVGYKVSPTAVRLSGVSARPILPWETDGWLKLSLALLALLGLAGVIHLRRKAF